MRRPAEVNVAIPKCIAGPAPMNLVNVLAARAYRKRRHHLTGADGLHGTCLLGVFPAAVGEPNVEPPVPEDIDPSFRSIPHVW